MSEQMVERLTMIVAAQVQLARDPFSGKDEIEEMRRRRVAVETQLRESIKRNEARLAELERDLADYVARGVTLTRMENYDMLECRVRVPRQLVMAARANATEIFASKLDEHFKAYFAKQEES